MAKDILEMDDLATQSEEQIRRFEHAEKATKDFSIDIIG
jgi:hypothetical protein